MYICNNLYTCINDPTSCIHDVYTRRSSCVRVYARIERRDTLSPFNHHFILSFRGQPIGASTPLIRWKILLPLKDARDSARVHDFEEDSN